MVGEFKSFRPHHRMSAARELLDRGFGKSARAEKAAHPRIKSGAGSEPVEGHSTPTNEIREIPESDEPSKRLAARQSQFRHPPVVPAESLPRTRYEAGTQTMQAHEPPTPPTATADEIDYWLDTYDSPLYEFMCECEHPDFDPFLAAIDDEYFESFTGCTDPECEVHGDPPDFDPNHHHY